MEMLTECRGSGEITTLQQATLSLDGLKISSNYSRLSFEKKKNRQEKALAQH